MGTGIGIIRVIYTTRVTPLTNVGAGATAVKQRVRPGPSPLGRATKSDTILGVVRHRPLRQTIGAPFDGEITAAIPIRPRWAQRVWRSRI